MPENSTATVGAWLREARERAGLSVRDIADRTKIPSTTLDALERDDYARLPGGIFLRAFVRSFAGEVGLDPEEAVRRFVARHPDASIEETPTPYVANPERIVVDEVPAAGRLWRILGWSLPLVLVIVYFGFGGRLTGWRPVPARPAPIADAAAEPMAAGSAPVLTTPVAPPQSPAAAPGTEAASPAPAATGSTADQGGRAAETGPPVETSAPLATSEGRFQLTLQSRGRCWVAVRSEGKVVFTSTLNAGERQDLTVGGEVILTVGNAGVIDLALDGKPARPLGAENQAITVKLNASNLDTFLLAR